VTVGEVLSQFEAWSEAKKEVTLAGRLSTTRLHGAMIFADLNDESGKLQLLLKQEGVGDEAFLQFQNLVDPADIVEATGTLFTTKRGEKTLEVATWRMLSKALLPLPEKFHGLQDIEKRERERELDLLSNPEVRERFVVRSKLVSAMRGFLDGQKFLEVETPMLHPIPGGANARPFVTHHNALDVDFFLRVAPELYLKRLVVGGFERVYEVARCFRNEGIDYAHNPEFTQIELYWAFVEKEAFIRFMEDLFRHMMHTALGTLRVEHESGALDFAGPWPRQTFREAVLEHSGIDIDEVRDIDALQAAARKKKLSVDFSKCVGLGEHYDELYKKTARAKLTGPVWISEYPIEMKPLANRLPSDPTKSATAQLVVHGAEVINAYYHELHDPIDQRQRFVEQQALAEQGSEEAQRMDEAFLRALEHGMPPTSGFGMGIDRLTAILTGAHSLKEVILFPTLRPEEL
jgi:lysyl-tRNA synthetase class 2